MEQTEIHELTAAYALDALDPDDEQRYEEHLRGCRDCQEELASLWQASTALAYAVEAPAPPAALRERILDQARSERTNVVPLRRRWAAPAVGGIAAVAASAAVALGVWASSLSESVERRDALIAILADPEAAQVEIPDANGRLVVSRTRAAALVLPALARAPSGKTYEAWVIERGQSPRPAGLFRGGGARTVVRLQRPVPEGAQVAVTVEEEGGVERPQGPMLFSAQA